MANYFERVGNIGYCGLVKETTKGVAVTPTDYAFLYDETMNTEGNFVDIQPIAANKNKTYTTVQGTRSHKGDLTIQWEPNTGARFADMLLTRTATTMVSPGIYQHTFSLQSYTNPNSYTIDLSTGDAVYRYFGCEVSKISPSWNDNEMQMKISISALGSFQGRDIATVSTNTITLATTYDPAPTKGLVVGDLVRLYKSSTQATLDTTITTINADGVTLILGASAAAFATGDSINLRPATPSFNTLPPCLWTKTYFQPSTTAATALTAPQYRVEQGSMFEIMHDFEDDDGAQRSGGFDPAALVRLTGDSTFTIKKAFMTNEDIIAFNNLTKSAWVIRHMSGLNNQYEFRVIFNNVKTDGTVVPDLKANEINYSTLNFHDNYDTTDGFSYSLVFVNALATI